MPPLVCSFEDKLMGQACARCYDDETETARFAYPQVDGVVEASFSILLAQKHLQQTVMLMRVEEQNPLHGASLL